MRYLVCYDIADDRRRDRLATLLLDFGPRLQESVFLCNLDDVLFQRMTERIRKTVEAAEDKVHVFTLCEACRKRVWVVGLTEVPEDPEFFIL